MQQIEDLKKRVTPNEFLRNVDGWEIDAMQKLYPWLPETYWAFLKIIGCGDVGGVCMYEGPVHPALSTDRRLDDSDVLLFADDYQGYCFGFDRRGRVVEFDPTGDSYVIDRPFIAFISQYLE